MGNRPEYEIQYKTLFQRIIRIISKGGLKELLIRTINAVKYKFLIIFSPIIIFFKPKGFFIFRNRKLKYFLHSYTLTWMNERIVEIPIVLDYIKNSKAEKILEFGAVLSIIIRLTGM